MVNKWKHILITEGKGAKYSLPQFKFQKCGFENYFYPIFLRIKWEENKIEKLIPKPQSAMFIISIHKISSLPFGTGNLHLNFSTLSVYKM
jgi:hypothetical protein